MMDAAESLKAARPRPRRLQAERREEAMNAILKAAERQFARNGRDGATLKAIAVDAGVDTALVHYYFGDRDGLVRAVFARKSAMINEIVMRGLDDYVERVGDQMTIAGVLNAFLRPTFETVANDPETWADFFTIFANANSWRVEGEDAMRAGYDGLAERLIEMLRRLSPATPPRDIYWFFHLFWAGVVQSLPRARRIEVYSGGLCNPTDILAVADSMVAVFGRGFEAIAAGGAASTPPR